VLHAKVKKAQQQAELLASKNKDAEGKIEEMYVIARFECVAELKLPFNLVVIPHVSQERDHFLLTAELG
jgi:hypothetical protein